MLIRAKAVLTMNGPILAPGSVRVSRGQITEVGSFLERAPDEVLISLPQQVLCPGFINAHCHLDYTGLKGALFSGKGFTDWIRQINGIKMSLGPEDYLSAIEEGFRLLGESGCTTVANIAAMPDLLLRLNRPLLRTWWFLELIDVRTRLDGEELLLGALHFFEQHPDWLGGFGLSPHAPYTASIELYRLAKKCSEELGMPFTTHIAESIDEQEMFLYARGPLYEFLKQMGRDNSDCGHGSALSHLMEHGVLTPQCLAVHLNYLQEYDWTALKQHPLTVVHCPKCHRYFGHARFPMERLEQSGCLVCLGTDSMASNDSLDLRAEIREARQQYPLYTSYQWIERVTVHPARALGQEGKLGVIRPGACADLVAFDLPPNTEPAMAVISGTQPCYFLMVNGEILRDRGAWVSRSPSPCTDA